MKLSRRDLVIAATTVVILIGGAAGFVASRNTALATSQASSPRYGEFESPRPFLVPDSINLNIFAEPSQFSQILVRLPATGIAHTIGFYGESENAPEWIKVRTLSGAVGWVRPGLVTPVSIQEAEQRILRDQQALEEAVRSAINTAVYEKVVELNLHGGAMPDEFHITAPVSTTESAAVFKAPVSAIMHGTIISSNKYQVDMMVTLFLHVNKDHVPSSTLEVSGVEFLSNTQTSGFSGSDAVKLLTAMF